MKSSPAKSTYKWWESDDKTKRLYTELLAEKIAKSPKRSSSNLIRSASSCSDLRSRLEALEGKEPPPPTSPGKRSTSIKSLTLDETASAPKSPRKYTFETVTIDTLAKYEYIKSPKKKPLKPSLQASQSSASLSSLSSSSPVPSSGSEEEYDKKITNWNTYERSSSGSSKEEDSPRYNTPSRTLRGNDKNTRHQERWGCLTKGISNERDKAPTTPTRGGLPPKTTTQDLDKRKSNPMFMLMTSSSKPELKSFGGKSYDAKGSPARKERLSSKLVEVPEYGSSSGGEGVDDRSSDSSDSGRGTERIFPRGKEERSYRASKIELDCLMTVKESDNNNNKSVSDAKARNNSGKNVVKKPAKPAQQSVEEAMDISQISKKFQSLCEEVEQLDFKMSEFAQDIQKLKLSIGISGSEDEHVELGSPKHHFRHAFTLAAGKDLLSERATARALLMRQYSSPTKSPRNISKLLKDAGIDKEMAEVDANKTKALEEELKKINEKDLSDHEIQEVLRNAKARYIDKPNFLEDAGFGNSRKKA